MKGELQGAALKVGGGRLVVFAEAGWARVLTPAASGVPHVGQNSLLARNLIFWLANSGMER